MAATATPCLISRDRFMGRAKSVRITIAGQTIDVDPKLFSTGSFGWYHSGKVVIEVDGVKLSVQVGLNLTVVNSKAAPPA